MNQIRILLADDHPAFLSGIEAELGKEPDMLVVGRASSGSEALLLLSKLAPDVLLLDMQMPDMTGVEVAQQIQKEQIQVLLLPLSGFAEPEYVTGMLEYGAAGYMTKDESISDIVKAVRKVANGGVHISGRVAFSMFSEQRHQSSAQARLEQDKSTMKARGMSPTLLSVLKLVAEGFNNQEIAEQLCRSEHTVRNHVDKLREISSVRWRPELVAWAWKNGIRDMHPEEFA